MRSVMCVTVGLAVVFMVACSSTSSEDQVLQEVANMDKEAIFEKAEAMFAQEEYEQARRYYQFVYDSFPNDPMGHRAALRVADTYAVKKDSFSLTEARLRYRDFVNRYPNDPNRPEALLKLGNTYFVKRGAPDLDLSFAKEALDAYKQLINLYPDSAYVEDARERIAALREMFAKHEWLVARFYAKNNMWRGVKWRLEYLKENYPDYPEMDEVNELLAKATAEVEEIDRRIEAYKAEAERRRKEAEDN